MFFLGVTPSNETWPASVSEIVDRLDFFLAVVSNAGAGKVGQARGMARPTPTRALTER